MEVYINKKELKQQLAKQYEYCAALHQPVTGLDIMTAIDACREYTHVEQYDQKPKRKIRPFTVDEVLSSLREVGINPDEPDVYFDEEDYRY